MSDFKVARNTLSQIASRMLVVAVSLLTTAILTRTLGVEGFGNYVFITSITLLFVGLTDFGTTTIAVREASLKKEARGEIFAGVLGLRLIFCLLVFFIFNLLVLALPQFSGLAEASFIASFVLFFLVLRTTSQSVLHTFLRLDLASGLEVIASILLLIFLLVFIFLSRSLSLSVLMIFWSISAFVSGLAALFLWRRFLPIKISFNFKQLKEIFSQSYPLGFYLLVYAVYDRGIDSFFLKTFAGSQAVGLYGLAYKIHGNLIFGAAFLMNSLFPVISFLKKDDDKLKIIFNKAFTLLLFFGLLVLFLGVVFAPVVIKTISGDEFLLSTDVLRLLLFATLFSFLNHLNGYFLISLNEQKRLLFYSLFSLTLNLVLNAIFIPKYTFWAAAVVTVLTESSIFVLTSIYLTRKYYLKISIKEFRNNLLLLQREKKNYFDFK